MKIPTGNMWAAILENSRISSFRLLHRYGDETGQLLRDANIFGPTVVTAIDESQVSYSDRIKSLVTISYAKDCIYAILLPILESYDSRGISASVNTSAIMPALRPLVECYANHIDRYKEFVPFSKKFIEPFAKRFCDDGEMFGLQDDDSRRSGIKICAFVSVATDDWRCFHQFYEDILLALLDRSAKVTGTGHALVDVRKSCRTVYLNDYSNYSNVFGDGIFTHAKGRFIEDSLRSGGGDFRNITKWLKMPILEIQKPLNTISPQQRIPHSKLDQEIAPDTKVLKPSKVVPPTPLPQTNSVSHSPVDSKVPLHSQNTSQQAAIGESLTELDAMIGLAGV